MQAFGDIGSVFPTKKGWVFLSFLSAKLEIHFAFYFFGFLPFSLLIKGTTNSIKGERGEKS